MPGIIDTMTNKMQSLWSGSSLAQRILLGGMAASAIAVFILLLVWLNKPSMRVLYSNLYPEDGASVVEVLKKENIPYKLQDGGSTVLVPEDKVYDLRLLVAGEGSLTGQGVGFEIFDESKIGQTDFVQHINYQRALQGELSRTISEIPDVEKARVHLVLPNKSLFIEEQASPTASVMIKLVPGRRLELKQVQSIVNLVASSVEGLEPGKITVTDTAGGLLYEPQDDDSLKGLSTNQLEYKASIERKLQNNIEQMLIPIVGPGKIMARVNADLDFSQRTITKQVFDPDSAVVRSEQKSEEESSGSSQMEGGVPEPAYTGAAASGQGTSQTSSRASSTVNFEINKEEHQIISPVGEIKRLSVAVVVDGNYETAEDGTRSFSPRSEEELARIKQLVQNAVGFDEARDDSIEVSSIAFSEPEVLPEPSIMNSIMNYAKAFAKPLLNSVLALLFLILVVRPIVLSLLRPRVSGEEAPGSGRGLPGGDERMALSPSDQFGDVESRQRKQIIEEYKAQALMLLEKNKEQALTLVKSWLKEREA